MEKGIVDRGRPKGSPNYFPTDTQRTRLYEAERHVDGFFDVDFQSLDEVDRFIKTVMKRKYWTDRTLVRRYKLLSSSVVYAEGGQLNYRLAQFNLPQWAWTKQIIAHEMAHAMCPPEPNFTKQPRAAHGREFAGTYLYLTGKICGAETKRQLRAQFLKHNVEWESLLAE